ncbi:MAG: HAMP domain-containing sensor histidine kinase [Bacteroidota bacterium]
MQISKFSRVTTSHLVVALATISFLGLAVLQIINLQSSLDTNRKIFRQKVHLACSKISDHFFEDRDRTDQLTEAAIKSCTKNISDPEIDMVMRSIIDPTLVNYGINTPYEYAVYKHKKEQDGFRFVLGDDGASLDFELRSCENPNERGHGWTSLTCSPDQGGDLHLALFFPEEDKYVFAQSQGALSLSILFIVLLIICFTYTMVIIRKQKKLSEIKNDFINNLTHEFKTPIASINIAANLLKRDDAVLNRERQNNYLNLIDQESKRLEGQVDKILQIAMLDSGNFTLDKQAMDVHQVIKDVIKSMSVAIEQRRARVKLSLDATESTIMGDATHMVNIIYNLVDNALKYTKEDPEIEIATSNEDEGVKISIRDNGVGIGEEIQKLIYDKFYRAETGNVHNAKGFGLGLSYVKKLVTAHKGKIDLSSKLNQGSEFMLYIPAS